MSAHHDPTKVFETSIIVKETRAIHQGRNGSTGEEYTLYQIVATRPNGQMIDLNLRSFEDLARDEVLPVEVTPFVSEQYGTSYTLKAKAKSKARQELEQLASRVERLERHLGLTSDSSSDLAAGPPPPPAPDRQPAAPPPPIQRQETGGGQAF
jgi:hypothetical protein